MSDVLLALACGSLCLFEPLVIEVVAVLLTALELTCVHFMGALWEVEALCRIDVTSAFLCLSELVAVVIVVISTELELVPTLIVERLTVLLIGMELAVACCLAPSGTVKSFFLRIWTAVKLAGLSSLAFNMVSLCFNRCCAFVSFASSLRAGATRLTFFGTPAWETLSFLLDRIGWEQGSEAGDSLLRETREVLCKFERVFPLLPRFLVIMEVFGFVVVRNADDRS